MVSNNNYSLDKIVIPIIEDLKTFEIEFERSIESDVRLINSITKYMMRKKEKTLDLRLLFYQQSFVVNQPLIHIELLQ